MVARRGRSLAAQAGRRVPCLNAGDGAAFSLPFPTEHSGSWVGQCAACVHGFGIFKIDLDLLIDVK